MHQSTTISYFLHMITSIFHLHNFIKIVLQNYILLRVTIFFLILRPGGYLCFSFYSHDLGIPFITLLCLHTQPQFGLFRNILPSTLQRPFHVCYLLIMVINNFHHGFLLHPFTVCFSCIEFLSSNRSI